MTTKDTPVATWLQQLKDAGCYLVKGKDGSLDVRGPAVEVEAFRRDLYELEDRVKALMVGGAT